MTDGVDAITSNPYMMGGMGMFGLPTTGAFGSYTTPASMMSSYGMMGGMGSMGMTSPYMTGMNGMMGSPYAMGMMGYNPTFMSQYMQIQEDIEKRQLQHTGDMNKLLLEQETQAANNKYDAMVEQLAADSGISSAISDLADMIEKGDADNICVEYDKVKNLVISRFGDYFYKNLGTKNIEKSVQKIIESLYSQLITGKRGETASLKEDIRKYGETPFWNGFWSNLHGKDYSSRYAEDAISHITGQNVSNKGGKDRMKAAGKWTEAIGEGATAFAIGGGIGRFFGKVGALIGGGLALAGDIIWQMAR